MGEVVFILIIVGYVCVAFATGDPDKILPIIGIAGVIGLVWIAKRFFSKIRYAKNTKRAEEAARREAEKERRRKDAVRQCAITRFRTSAFVSTLIQDFSNRNWRDLDYTQNGCYVYPDKIVTPCQTYIYINYGLANLDMEGCEELAEYLGTVYGRPYSAVKETKFFGGVSNSYTSYLGSDGSVSTVRDAWGEERTIAYRLYSQNTVPSPPPKGRAW